MPESYKPYNPLDKKNLGKSIKDAILDLEHFPLPPALAFVGAGIYAIYYTGDSEYYRELGAHNRLNRIGIPIYVGKAIPEGGRKGGITEDAYEGNTLYRRLKDHADTIEQAANLELDDFYCRYLTLDDIWIPLGENLLIESFNPIWNQVIDGFGNHDPGSGRRNQKRSVWDTIHPGRSWSEKLALPDFLWVAGT